MQAGGAELAVQLGYLVAQAPVVVVEFSDAGVGEFEPLPQGRVGAALGLVDYPRACGRWSVSWRIWSRSPIWA